MTDTTRQKNGAGQKASLTLPDGRSFDLPIHRGTQGPEVLDISTLYRRASVFTYDPGFTSTASCSSRITYIDGDAGELLYRGYPIEQLAQHSHFLETSYLLLYGELPESAEYQAFENSIIYHSMLHEQMRDFYRGFRRDAHPMAVLVAVVGALSSFYHDSLDIRDPHQRDLACLRLIAKMPTVAGWAFKYHYGKPFTYPRNRLSYAHNFLSLCFALPTEDYDVSDIVVRAMDRIFILHADHEQNASTSTVRLAGSSGANPFACVAAGVASLWGPAHGGANEAVIQMLEQIGDKKNIPAFIARAKSRDDPFRLMGFGHRVYKNYDPRAAVLRESCHEVLEHLGFGDDPMLELALELERIALEDPYFIERKLFPNVDFYSGIILRAMGFPTKMFTVLFAVARTAGWVSHWREMVEDADQRIGRPRQLYLGPGRRHLDASRPGS